MFGFAWVGPTETAFDPAVHDREDEDVFGFQIEHSEGDFPMLSVELRNPRRQLLAGPNIWAWLSRDGVPLFFGRLVAIPEEMHAEIVRINFIARPADYSALKSALADTLRVAPFWDPVWINEERLTDPDTVLESRTQIWHIDRVTHAVSVSDIIAGEDGTIELGGGDFAYDSLDVKYGAPPVRRVRVDADISWDQIARGSVNVSDSFGGVISSYTGQGLEADWPEAGKSLGGGWSIQQSSLQRLDGVSRPAAYRDVPVQSLKPRSDAEGSKAEVFRSAPYKARFYRWDFLPTVVLGYDVSRSRSERVRFTLVGDVQRVFSEPGEEEEIVLSLSTQKVSQPVDPGGALPIRDLSSPAYAKTDRGRASLGYLVAVARAKLLARARAVELTVAIPLPDAMALSCRKSVTITDPRLPAGIATGKVTSYRIVASGDGSQYGEVTIGCTIGTGEVVSADPGDPVYGDDGYEAGYQQRSGQTHEVVPGEVKIADLSDAEISDDGIDFAGQAMDRGSNVMALDVSRTAGDQEAVLSKSFPDIPAAVEELNKNFTEVWLELRPLTGGPFHTELGVGVSQLMVPRTISL